MIDGHGLAEEKTERSKNQRINRNPDLPPSILLYCIFFAAASAVLRMVVSSLYFVFVCCRCCQRCSYAATAVRLTGEQQ